MAATKQDRATCPHTNLSRIAIVMALVSDTVAMFGNLEAHCSSSIVVVIIVVVILVAVVVIIARITNKECIHVVVVILIILLIVLVIIVVKVRIVGLVELGFVELVIVVFEIECLLLIVIIVVVIIPVTIVVVVLRIVCIIDVVAKASRRSIAEAFTLVRQELQPRDHAVASLSLVVGLSARRGVSTQHGRGGGTRGRVYLEAQVAGGLGGGLEVRVDDGVERRVIADELGLEAKPMQAASLEARQGAAVLHVARRRRLEQQHQQRGHRRTEARRTL